MIASQPAKLPGSVTWFRKTFPYTTWTMTMIHHRFRQPSLLFSTDHSPIWWKVHSQCSSNFSFSGFVGPETSLPMGLNSMDVAGACLLNAVLTKNFIRKQASLQSSHTTRSQQTRYHTFQTVPPLGSPLLRLSYSTCPAAWTISYVPPIKHLMRAPGKVRNRFYQHIRYNSVTNGHQWLRIVTP